MHVEAINAQDPRAAVRRARRRIRTLCGVLLLAGVTALGGLAGSAQAGEWVQVSCVNPDGSGAGSSGWLSMIAGGGYGSNTDTACGPDTPMYAILSADAAVGTGSAETLRYIPPAGSTLAGGQLDVGLFADGGGYNASGTAVVYSPEYVYDASNVFFQCASGLPPCSPGGYGFSGTLAIPGGRGGELYVSAACGGAAGASCSEHPSHGAWSLAQVSSAELRLSNSATPAASSVTGTLLEGGARGSTSLGVAATDPGGPGIYNMTVQADGQTLYAGTPESNGGECIAVGSSGGALMFDSGQPCKQSEQVDLPIDTTSLKDGQHTLTVRVTDAAQNTSVVLDRAITTDNAPANAVAPSTLSNVAPTVGTTLSATPGMWSAPPGAGQVALTYQWETCDGAGGGCTTVAGATSPTYTAAGADAGRTVRVAVTGSDSDGSRTLASAPSAAVMPAPASNGVGASENARIRLSSRSTLARSYPRRALTVSGHLETSGGTPIVAARLDIAQQPANSAGLPKLSFATTAQDGSFTVHVPTGPSRLIVIGYRARSNDAAYATQASVKETVNAGVHILITPRQTVSAGTISILGQVAGPIPREGLTAELLVHYRGQWEPFREAHVTRNGRFRVRYQFQGSTGRFPFRAKVIGGQAGYPYATGQSNTVQVTTR